MVVLKCMAFTLVFLFVAFIACRMTYDPLPVRRQSTAFNFAATAYVFAVVALVIETVFAIWSIH